MTTYWHFYLLNFEILLNSKTCFYYKFLLKLKLAPLSFCSSSWEEFSGFLVSYIFPELPSRVWLGSVLCSWVQSGSHVRMKEIFLPSLLCVWEKKSFFIQESIALFITGSSIVVAYVCLSLPWLSISFLEVKIIYYPLSLHSYYLQ